MFGFARRCVHRLDVAKHKQKGYRYCNALPLTRLCVSRKNGSLFPAKSKEGKAWDAQEQFYKDLKRYKDVLKNLHDGGQK